MTKSVFFQFLRRFFFFALVLGSLSISTSVIAEYRAFRLKIVKIEDPSQFRALTSTLDPLQYPDYFPIQLDEKILTVHTWLCPGRTNEVPICPDPKADEEDSETETNPPPVKTPPPKSGNSPAKPPST